MNERIEDVHRICDLLITLSVKNPTRSVIDIIKDANAFIMPSESVLSEKNSTNSNLLNKLKKYYKLKD